MVGKVQYANIEPANKEVDVRVGRCHILDTTRSPTDAHVCTLINLISRCIILAGGYYLPKCFRQAAHGTRDTTTVEA